MITTFRETWASLQDFTYGKVILKKTIGQSLWYFCKYLLLFGIAGLILALGLLSYFTPQFSRLVDQNFPDVKLSVTDGQVTTNLPQPFVAGDQNFAFIINTAGTIDDLAQYSTGVLILKDKLLVKSEDGQTRIQNLSDFNDLTVDKSQIVSWTQNHKLLLLGLGFLSLSLIIILLSGFYWLWTLLASFVWSAILWATSHLFKRPHPYLDILKLVLHASVISLFFQVLSLFFPASALSLIGLGLFVFYSLTWLWHLPAPTK